MSCLGAGGHGDGVLVPILGDVFPVGVGGDGGFVFGFAHSDEAVPAGAKLAMVALASNLFCDPIADVSRAACQITHRRNMYWGEQSVAFGQVN